MEQSELLRFLVTALENLNLPYFITGSTVTIFYGEPRFTNDIDVVVDLPGEEVSAFCRRFPDGDFYVSEEAVRDAVARRSQFKIIHPRSGLKIDLMIPSSSEFDKSRFAAPEDAIIKKLEYYREGGSDKHLRDIAGVLKTSRSEIDLAYIERWTTELGLTEVWHSVRKRVLEDE